MKQLRNCFHFKIRSLSDVQIEETVKKFEDFLLNKGGQNGSQKENWGLKKLAYRPIQHKKVVF